MLYRDFRHTSFIALTVLLCCCQQQEMSVEHRFAIAFPISFPSMAKADHLFDQMQWSDALRAYNFQLPSCDQATDSIYALQQMAYAAIKTGALPKGQKWMEKTASMLDREQEAPDIYRAGQWFLEGLIWESQGLWGNAMSRYQQALPIYENTCGKGHWRYLQCLSRVGLLYAERSAFVDSAAVLLPYLLDAFGQDPHLRKRLAEVYLASTWRCLVERNYEQGVLYGDSAILLCRKYDPEDRLSLARCLYATANLLLKRQDESNQATEEQKQQHYLRELNQILPGIDHYYAREISALQHLFTPLRKETVPFIRQSALQWQRARMPAFSDWLIGRCYEQESGMADSAIYYYLKVLDRHAGDSVNTHWRLIDWTYWSLYALYEQKDSFHTSQRYLYRDMAIGTRPGGKSESPYNFVVWHNLARLFSIQYQTYRISGDLYQAAEYYLRTDSLYFSSLPSHDENSILRFHQQVGDRCYADGIGTFLALYRIDGSKVHLRNAYQFMERRKSYLLYRNILLRESEGPEARGLNMMAMKQTSRFLQARLAYLELANRSHIPMPAARTDSLSVFRHKIAGLEDAMVKVRDLYYRALRQPLPDLEAVRKKAGLQKAVISYLVGRDSCFALYLDHQTIQLASVCDTDSLRQHVTIFRQWVATPGDNRYIEPGRWLYRHLIGIFEPLLADKSAILIVPDRELSQIPFESLIGVDMPADYTKLVQQRGYAIYRYAFSYTPSIKLWYQHDDHIHFPAAIDVWVDDDLKYASRLSSSLRHTGLPFTTHALSEEAMLQFKHRAPESAILHLLLHGSSSPYHRGENYLIFGRRGGDTLRLRGDAIEQLHLQGTQLVVLSACETAVGESTTGEGTFSLSRSFQQAGADNVIASLWKAGEKATVAITGLFYDYVRSETSVATALHRAKCSYLAQEHANPHDLHPAHWAVLVANL